jgi:hypothetical protein
LVLGRLGRFPDYGIGFLLDGGFQYLMKTREEKNTLSTARRALAALEVL